MALRYVLDEDLRGVLWRAIQRHNRTDPEPIDVVRVGDLPDLPLGTPDPDILEWAERAGRVVVSHDQKTMGGHLQDHLQAGNHLPGLFLIRPRCALSQVLGILVEAAYRSDPLSWQDRVEFIP
jgi:hypothetical protein